MNKHSRDYDAPYYPEWDDDGGYIVPDDEDDAPDGGVREPRKPKPHAPAGEILENPANSENSVDEALV